MRDLQALSLIQLCPRRQLLNRNDSLIVILELRPLLHTGDVKDVGNRQMFRAVMPEPAVIRIGTVRPDIVSRFIRIQNRLFQESCPGFDVTLHGPDLIGQVFDTYWLMEYQDSLYIVDQHAAHEKVLFEKLMKQYREKTVTSQMLFPSAVIEPGAAEASLLRSRIPVFEELGYEIEEFGGNTFKITAVPANLYHMDPKELFTPMTA